MSQTLVALISTVLGGLAGTYFSYKGKHEEQGTKREGLFADFTKDQLARFNYIYEERDTLKEQNIELNAKVKQQSEKIDTQSRKIDKLQAKVKAQNAKIDAQSKKIDTLMERSNDLQEMVIKLTHEIQQLRRENKGGIKQHGKD